MQETSLYQDWRFQTYFGNFRQNLKITARIDAQNWESISTTDNWRQRKEKSKRKSKPDSKVNYKIENYPSKVDYVCTLTNFNLYTSNYKSSSTTKISRQITEGNYLARVGWLAISIFKRIMVRFSRVCIDNFKCQMGDSKLFHIQQISCQITDGNHLKRVFSFKN